MKQILADITPMGSNNLFVTHYWPDKQTDPPLHYHEDYMLCLTLHVRGQRIMDDAVEDFTPSDYRSRFKTSPLTPDTTN